MELGMTALTFQCANVTLDFLVDVAQTLHCLARDMIVGVLVDVYCTYAGVVSERLTQWKLSKLKRRCIVKINQ